MTERGGGWRAARKSSNKLFAEAVNTEIKCIQVNKSVCRKTETPKKLFAAGAAYKINVSLPTLRRADRREPWERG